MKNVTITKDRFNYIGEDDIMRYYCTLCESSDVERGYDYCPNCGAKITWKLEK